MDKLTVKEIVLAVLAKVGTVAADRRFWLGVVTFLVAQFGLNFKDQTAQELVDILAVFVPSAVVLISWAIRQPSGLLYNDSFTASVVTRRNNNNK